jgi:hypothetical protein
MVHAYYMCACEQNAHKEDLAAYIMTSWREYDTRMAFYTKKSTQKLTEIHMYLELGLGS